MLPFGGGGGGGGGFGKPGLVLGLFPPLGKGRGVEIPRGGGEFGNPRLVLGLVFPFGGGGGFRNPGLELGLVFPFGGEDLESQGRALDYTSLWWRRWFCKDGTGLGTFASVWRGWIWLNFFHFEHPCIAI